MNVSRGFRRLSVLSGVLGFLFYSRLYAIHVPNDPIHRWDGSLRPGWDGLPIPFSHVVLGAIALTVIPTGITLLVGWAVAGFRADKSN